MPRVGADSSTRGAGPPSPRVRGAHNCAFSLLGIENASKRTHVSPLAISLTLAIAMALTAGGAFLYLRLTKREPIWTARDGVSPQPRGFDRAQPTKLIQTECSATYIPVDGPEFTGSFPPVRRPAGESGGATRNIRRGASPALDMLEATMAPDATSETRDISPIDRADTLFEKVIVHHDGLRCPIGEDQDAPTHRYANPVKPRAVFTPAHRLIAS